MWSTCLGVTILRKHEEGSSRIQLGLSNVVLMARLSKVNSTAVTFSSKCCMQVFDLMGYPPCHYNKINIHIGGIYEDKEHTIRRFAENFNTRLSPNLQSRLTVENDDRPNSYSMTDLLLLHNLTGIPLVSAIWGPEKLADCVQ